jgi:hypothetical protein
MKILKPTPPNRGPLLISFLENDNLQLLDYQRRQQPVDTNSRFRIKSDRLIRIQKTPS